MNKYMHLLQFDIRANWKWHLYMYPFIVGLTYIVLYFGSFQSLDDYFHEPVLSVDMVYLIAMSGVFMTFCFPAGFVPTKEKTGFFYLPTVEYLKQLPVPYKTIVHYYFIKYVISLVLCIGCIGILLYPSWQTYFTVNQYISFLFFWLGIGLGLGLISISLYPVKNYILLSAIGLIITVVVLLGLIMIFYKMYHGGVVGFIVKTIQHNKLLLPIISLVLGIMTYPLAHKNMIKRLGQGDAS